MQSNPDHFPPKQGDMDRQADERRKSLQTSISNIESQIASTQAQLKEISAQLRSPTPSKTVQSHIRLLHDYNEIRDVGQGLLGLIADRRGVRYGDVLGEFGVDADD